VIEECKGKFLLLSMLENIMFHFWEFAWGCKLLSLSMHDLFLVCMMPLAQNLIQKPRPLVSYLCQKYILLYLCTAYVDNIVPFENLVNLVCILFYG